jgi:putative salt-induced outer membrane protein YdiY
MTGIRGITGTAVAGALLLLGSSSLLSGQDDPPLGWSDVAEVTFVLTAGNASASTLGFKNAAAYYWPNASFQLSLGGIRAESGVTTRTATGTPGDFSVREETETETTAESYYVKSRYDRKVSDAAFLFGGAGWDRNTFAGVENRFGFVGGAGRAWLSEDARRFKTDLGLSYTIQKDVVENPDVNDSFMGIRGSYDFFHKLSETTDFASVLVVDENLSETSDLRADWVNSVAVAMSSKLALKTSLQILYDHEPALVGVALGDDQVFSPLDKVDSVFTVALVVNF